MSDPVAAVNIRLGPYTDLKEQGQEMESQASVLDFAAHRKARQTVEEEFSFHNMEELLAFASSSIIASKRKYVRLAEEAHVSPSTVSKLAHGETRSPHAATVFAVMGALGFEAVWRR